MDLPGADPHSIRRTLVEEVVRRGEGDVGLFYTQAVLSDGRVVAADVVSTAYGEPATQGYQAGILPIADVTAAPLQARTSFLDATTTFGSWASFEQRPGTQVIRQSFGLGDQLRLLAFHGDRFLGWIGVFRRWGAPVFAHKDRRRMRPLVHRCQTMLAAAAALSGGDPAAGPAYLVVSPDGRVLHASVRAAPWLERPGFRDALVATIRSCGETAPDDRPRVMDRAEATISRLTGDTGSTYLVCVRPLQPLRLRPIADLSPTQRRIAEFLVAGAQVGEVASTLEISAETVRTHLQAIYLRLGVANRLELARALEDQTS